MICCWVNQMNAISVVICMQNEIFGRMGSRNGCTK